MDKTCKFCNEVIVPGTYHDTNGPCKACTIKKVDFSLFNPVDRETRTYYDDGRIEKRKIIFSQDVECCIRLVTQRIIEYIDILQESEKVFIKATELELERANLNREYSENVKPNPQLSIFEDS